MSLKNNFSKRVTGVYGQRIRLSKSEKKIQPTSGYSNVERPKEIQLRKIARVNSNLIPFDELTDDFKRIDFHFIVAHEWIKKGDDSLRSNN